MNSNQIKAFKKLVKDNGFTEVSHIVEKKIGMNYGMYLTKCEPLFILSRIRSCVSDESLLALIDTIHMQWLNIMIRNCWSTRLNNAIREYGQQAVKGSIISLSQEGKWGFEAGRQIDYNFEEVDEHYDCFDLIATKIEHAEDDSPCNDEAREEDREAEGASDLEESPEGEGIEETLSRQAQSANERIMASLGSMQQDFAIVGQFFRLCATQGDLANELGKANHQLEAMRLLSQRSDEEIDRLKQLAIDKDSAFSQAVAELKQKEEALAQKEGELAQKEELLSQKEEQLTALRHQLQQLQQASEAKPTAPTKKIIPESKLRELVAVGDKMIRQLTPFLAQYDIIVNPHK